MKAATVILCAIFVAGASALSCLPCNRKKCHKITCPGSKTLDLCGCCLVCAKLEGEECGGDFGIYGTCGRGLACAHEEGRVLEGGLMQVVDFVHTNVPGECTRAYSDCAEACRDSSVKPSQSFLSYSGKNVLLAPGRSKNGFWAHCDCTPGDDWAWTLIQRRASGVVSFDKKWWEYVDGFGFSTNDFWLGLERIHEMTKRVNHEMMIAVQYEDSITSYSTYGIFGVGNASTSYTLSVGANNGDGSEQFVKTHHGMKFSTSDKDNDKWHGECAATLQGGWWYNSCTEQNLNGVHYGTYPYNSLSATGPDRITWNSCREQLVKMVEIKIRPTAFVSSGPILPN